MGYNEGKLVDTLNAHFHTNGIEAIAYRQKQSRFSEQWVDITVDSLDSEWYLAVEVKSKRGRRALNFNSDFTTNKDGEHQLARMMSFCKLSGRTPYIVYYCRMGRGRPNEVYVLDGYELFLSYLNGNTSIKAKELSKYNKIRSNIYELIGDINE